jgi:hypothetical protein
MVVAAIILLRWQAKGVRDPQVSSEQQWKCCQCGEDVVRRTNGRSSVVGDWGVFDKDGRGERQWRQRRKTRRMMAQVPDSCFVAVWRNDVVLAQGTRSQGDLQWYDRGFDWAEEVVEIADVSPMRLSVGTRG